MVDAVETAWTSVDAEPTERYARAVAGGRDARMTLTVGGGIARIADRFLTTEVLAGTGSGRDYIAVWKPTSIDEVVRPLGHRHNHRGLLQLALAMKAFDISKEAAKGLRRHERSRHTGQEAGHFYQVLFDGHRCLRAGQSQDLRDRFNANLANPYPRARWQSVVDIKLLDVSARIVDRLKRDTAVRLRPVDGRHWPRVA